MATGTLFEGRLENAPGPREALAPRPVRGLAALIDAVVFYPLLLLAIAAGVVAAGGAVGAVVTGSRVGPALENLGDVFRAAGLTVGAGVVATLAGLAALVVMVTQWSMLSSSGQTIGKRLMGIRIVDERGAAAGFLRALVLRRWLFNAVYASLGGVVMAWVPFIGWAWWCLDVLPLFGEERRCLHDHVAVTDVRWVRPSGPGAARVLVGLALVAAGVGSVVAFVGPAEWRALGAAIGWKVAPVTPPVTAPVTPTVAPPVAPPYTPPVIPPALEPVLDAGGAPAPRGPAGPVAWTYEDSAGVTHVVQDLAQVPEPLRAKARPIH